MFPQQDRNIAPMNSQKYGYINNCSILDIRKGHIMSLPNRRATSSKWLLREVE